MAAATEIEVQPAPSSEPPAEASNKKPWKNIQKRLLSLESDVKTRVESFRKSIDAARTKGAERIASLKQTFAPAQLKTLLAKPRASLDEVTRSAEKLVADGKKRTETTLKDLGQKLGLAKVSDLQGLAKIADLDAIKDAVSGLQKKLSDLRHKVEKLAEKAPVASAPAQSTE